MARDPFSSPQTASVLVAFLADPMQWRYGYDLARETGLKSGTLYPILARLADREFLERQWEQDPPGGKPPRHLYRLTVTGLQLAGQATARSHTNSRTNTAVRLGLEGA